MNVLSDFGVKEPLFDAPDEVDGENLPICDGSRVALFSHGIQITAQVTAIERLGTMFVGRVLAFNPRNTLPIGLVIGDYVRFRPRDVHWIE